MAGVVLDPGTAFGSEARPEGLCEAQFHRYLDDFGLREQILTVKGTGLANGDGN